MERRPFGRAGEVPVVGIGTWNMEADDRAQAVRAIRAALDAGARHVDTAEMYGSGECERIVAEAIAGRRDEVFLVSKVLPSNASRTGTVRACEASLKRLGTDRLDCYLLHWPGDHALEDTFAAFEELERTGKIRSYGVSNFDVDLLRKAAKLGRIACNQVLYYLKERYAEAKLLPVCEKLGIALVAYSPFGSGDFPDSRVLDAIAKAHDATARQVALAFLIRKPGTFAIPKSSNSKRALQNAQAAALQLTADEVRRIEAAFPVADRSELPTL